MAIDFKKLVKGLFIKDSSDPSKGFKLEIDPAAATNTTTTILAEQQTNVTLSLPGETSELVGDSANQTLQNKTIDAANNTIVGITDAEISATAGVDVTKLADGSVDNTEFQYLNGVSSNIQTQLTINANDINGHITNPSGAHAASAISNTPSGNLSATDLQAAVNELQSDIDTRALASNLTAHITDTTDAHLASAIGYSGNANSTVEGALDNLYTYKLTVGSSQQLVSDLNANSNKITALATPVSGTDAANKNYVDGIAAGLDPKESVRVATTTTVGGSYATTPSNGRFTGAATTIDGVTLSANDRVLIKDQADAKQNGIYVYDGAGQFTRSADMDGSPSSEVSGGNFVFVAQGTTNGASGFVLVASGIVTLNTDNLNFTQFSGGANSANKTLSNLDAPTSINQDLIPDAANSRNLGSTTNNFFDGYITRLKDPSNVVSFHTENRQLLDSSGVSSVTFSSPTEVSFNNKKLNLIGSAAGLAYATNKQNVQEYIKNLIPDGDAEGANIISVYNDSSTTRPVDGTGGTQANLAATITSTNPLSGTNSFLLTKSGSASTQGSGFSIPFTVPIGQQAKVLQIDIDYIVNSGTFVAGSSSAESDMIVYIYDVTNSTLIEPSSIKFLSNSSTISDKFTANFQTSATGTSYRLILHCQSTSTANYALKCEFSVKPCNYVYGTPITNDISFTPTLTNAGNATAVGAYRQVGSKAEIIYTVTIGSTLPTGTIAVSKPSNLSLGYSANTTIPDATAKGIAAATGTTFVASVRWDNANQRFDFLGGNGQQFWNATVPLTWTNGDIITFAVTVPITGWSSSTQMSDSVVWDDDVGQVQAFAFSSTTPPNGWLYADGSAVNRATYADLFKKIGTTFGAGDGSTTFNLPDLRGIFVRGAGSQTFGSVTYSGTLGTKQNDKMQGHRHGTGYADTNAATTGNTGLMTFHSSATQNVQGPRTDSGTIIKDPVADSSGNGTPRVGAETNPANIALTYFIKYTRGVSPVISATELVSASYNTTAGQSITTATVTIVDFGTKLEDSHGAVTTGGSWKFIAPVAGEYQVNAGVMIAGGNSLPAGNECNLSLLKNGADYKVLKSHYGQAASTAAIPLSGSAKVKLNAGEYFDIRVYQTTGSTSNLITQSRFNYVDVFRIK